MSDFEKWQSPCGRVTLYRGDCLEILPTLAIENGVAIVTDPPYLTGEACIVSDKQNCGGVGLRKTPSETVGNPWGYSLDWIEVCRRFKPEHWIIYANYQMLGGICTALKPSCVFTWRKSNAPNMVRPVPRLDCEFVVWSRSGNCARMGEFKSMVIDVPMPQAGCFATERILESGTGKAAHPCQKPIGVVYPFVDRIESKVIIDPYSGTGTTAEAAIKLGRKFIGCEKEKGWFELSIARIIAALAAKDAELPLEFDEPEQPTIFDLEPAHD